MVKKLLAISVFIYCIYVLTIKVLATDGQDSIATVSSEASGSSDLSSSPSGTLDTDRQNIVFPREEIQALQKPVSEFRSWPTIDSTSVRTSVPPSIAARRRLKQPQLGLWVNAPNKLVFPEKEVSSKEQWVEIGNSYNGKENIITIADEREGNGAWTVTVSGSDFTDREEIIQINNLTMNIFSMTKQGISNTDISKEHVRTVKKVHFQKMGEPYLLAQVDNGYSRGIFDLSFGLKFRIPPNTSAGDYNAELVLTIL